MKEKAKELKVNVRNENENYYDYAGTYLGSYYHTGIINDEHTSSIDDALVVVGTVVTEVEETVNPKMTFITNKNVDADFKINDTKASITASAYDTDGNPTSVLIKQTINTKKGTGILKPGGSENKQVILSTTTTSNDDLIYDSYIAQIMGYTNAVGRRDTSSVPGNLSYVHSDDSRKTMANSNEPDETWAERIIITAPTGNDESLSKKTIILISIASIGTIAVAIVLIKKFVIK